MEAIDLLREEQKRFRYYEVHALLLDNVNLALKDFRQKYPQDNWDGYLQEITCRSADEPAIYGTKPIIKWGPADTSIFRKKWGIELPGWMEEFYSQVTCGLLPMLNQIRIFSPEEALTSEDERREACDELHLPYRLIRFADGAPDGSGFSLRQRLSDDTWEVIPSSIESSTEEYQSEDWEYVVEKDKDINAWLLRMLNTDGHPLMIGRGQYEPMHSKRLK
jgi:hypothetical protein